MSSSSAIVSELGGVDRCGGLLAVTRNRLGGLVIYEISSVFLGVWCVEGGSSGGCGGGLAQAVGGGVVVAHAVGLAVGAHGGNANGLCLTVVAGR
jgi:hypothetical protein